MTPEEIKQKVAEALETLNPSNTTASCDQYIKDTI